MSLKQISEKDFLKKISGKKFEDVAVIKMLEKRLKAERGYVVKWPKKGESVILLVSGGLDSITCWYMLMKKYGLRVYPLTIDKGNKRRKFEEISLRYFSKRFKKEFGEQYVEPFHINSSFKELHIPVEKAELLLHPKSLLENITNDGIIKTNFSLGSYTMSPILSKMYAEYIYLTKHERIYTIFTAVSEEDGSDRALPEQSFTALRAQMWGLCQTTHDFNWQFLSPVFEKEKGLCYDKADIVKIGTQYGLPLEYTWSCYFGDKMGMHCGKCGTCIARKYAYERTGIEDKTVYYDQVYGKRQRIVHLIKTMLR